MKRRTLGEMISYASQQLDQMDIKQEYKMKLLGMMTAIGCEVKDCAWIPCSERLPEDAGKYLVQTDDGILVGGYSDIGWMFPCHVDEVIAWMPLPEPYQEVKHE